MITVQEESPYSSVCSLTLGLQLNGIGVYTGRWIDGEENSSSALPSSRFQLDVQPLCPAVQVDTTLTVHSEAPEAPWTELDVEVSLSPLQLRLAPDSLTILMQVQQALGALSASDVAAVNSTTSSSDPTIKPSISDASTGPPASRCDHLWGQRCVIDCVTDCLMMSVFSARMLMVPLARWAASTRFVFERVLLVCPCCWLDRLCDQV